MHDVFLSHSSKDHDATTDLYQDLLHCGFKVWFDEVSMEPGDSLVKKIGNAIKSSANLAVLLSGNSVGSRWVEEEVSIAVSGKLAGEDVKVVPILLEDVDLPPFLSHIKYVDFRPSANHRREFGRLVKMLLSSSIKGGALLRLVSDAALATATAQYSDRFSPGHVVNFSPEDTPEDPRNYWLTPNDEGGTISLKLPHSYPIRLVRILNTQNQKNRDRATSLVSVQFTEEGSEFTVWRGPVPLYPKWLNLWFDSVYSDTVHVNVEEWKGKGGGLNCIEIYTEY